MLEFRPKKISLAYLPIKTVSNGGFQRDFPKGNLCSLGTETLMSLLNAGQKSKVALREHSNYKNGYPRKQDAKIE